MDIKQNASFMVDHRRFGPGLYISRIDSDITTYDMRTCRPNSEKLMDNVTMHTFEHMISTYIRNTDLDVIYFGPMGCQTGVYLLMRTMEHGAVVELIKTVLERIGEYDGEMPGNSEIECGNYRSLSMQAAKEEAALYYSKIKNLTENDLEYK